MDEELERAKTVCNEIADAAPIKPLSGDERRAVLIATAKEQASDRYGTHYDDCWRRHPRCLALMLALELEATRRSGPREDGGR